MNHQVLLLALACLTQGLASSQVLIVVGTTAITADVLTHECLNRGVQAVNDTSIFGGWLKNCKSGSSTPTEAPGDAPNTSGGRTFERNEGEKVTFICEVSGMRKNDTFAWISPPKGKKSNGFPSLPAYQKQGDKVIMPTSTDFYSFANHNRTVWEMTIKNIRRQDAGLHSCIVQSSINSEVTAENFTLVVLYPVEIRGVSPSGPPHVRPDEPNVVYFNETENATIVCLSDGNPTPDTFWRRGDSPRNNLPSGNKLSLARNLTIYNISVADEGLYTCDSRQLGGVNWDSFNVTVKVQHKPILTEVESLVRKKKGSSAELVCNINSDPLDASGAWFKGRKLVTIGTKTTQHRSRLFITNLVPARDYGNYTCVITNALGSSTCNFEITGRPVKPDVISSSVSDKKHVCALEWTYEDYDIPTVKKFRIYYIQKKYIPDGLHDMPYYEVDLKYDPERPMHYRSTIHDLKGNSTYHVELFAINDYGQGDVETFECTTAAVDRRRANAGAQDIPKPGYLGENGSSMTSPPLITVLVSLCAAAVLLFRT